MKKYKPLFLTGTARGGTNLVKWILESNKDIVNTYINAKTYLAKIYINTGKWDDAFEVLSDISTKMKLVNLETQFEVNFNLGKILALKNSHEESRSYFQKSIDKYEEYYYQLLFQG